jgi:hypothetical protein
MDKVLLYHPSTDTANVEYVESPVSFTRGPDGELMPTDDGIFSYAIFGTSPKARRATRAKIKLGGDFVHPLVFIRIFERMGKDKFHSIMKGEKLWKIEKGEIIEADENDPDGWTGISELKKRMEDFKPKKTESFTRNKLVEFIKANGTEIFITEHIVIPAFYRDFKVTPTGITSDPINKMYETLLGLTKSYRSLGDIVDRNRLAYHIQMGINEIYRHLRNLYKGKGGIAQGKLLGRPISYTSRTVISAPEFTSKKFGQGDVNSDTNLYPLDIVIGNFYPFMIYHIREYMAEVYNEDILNEEIEELLHTYVKSWALRLEPVEFTVEDEAEGVLKKRTFDIEVKNLETGEVRTKPLTSIELCYIAATRAVVGKHMNNTRFPVLKTQNTLTSKVNIATTLKFYEAEVRGETFKKFPITEGVPPEELMMWFEQTLKISNTLLPSYDGDFDGDKLDNKGIWTKEANEENVGLLSDKATLFNLMGDNLRHCGREAAQCMFMVTVDPSGKNKRVSPSDAQRIISMSHNDITIDDVAEFLFDFGDGSKYEVNDIITLKKNDYKPPLKHNEIQTTIGRLLVNKIIFECTGHPYINERINAKNFTNIMNELGMRVQDDDLDAETFKLCIDRGEDFRMRLSGVFNPGYSYATLRLDDDIEAYKDKLVEEYSDRLDANDLDAVDEIYDKVLKKWSDRYEGKDPAVDWYLSGAKPNARTHLAPALIMVGFKPTVDGRMELIRSCYKDGVNKKEAVTNANVASIAAVARAKDTAISGYQAKKIATIYQAVSVTADDCGSKEGITANITKANVKNWIGQFMIENGSLVELNNKNLDKYIGKSVVLRSPMFCKTKGGYCATCTGTRYSKLGIKNIGLTMAGPSGQMGQKMLSKVHNLQVTANRIDDMSPYFTQIEERPNWYDVSKEEEHFTETYSPLIEAFNVDDVGDRAKDGAQKLDEDISLALTNSDTRKSQILINNGLVSKAGILKSLDVLMATGKLHITQGIDRRKLVEQFSLTQYILEEKLTETDATKAAFKSRPKPEFLYNEDKDVALILKGSAMEPLYNVILDPSEVDDIETISAIIEVIATTMDYHVEYYRYTEYDNLMKSIRTKVKNQLEKAKQRLNTNGGTDNV